MTDPIEKIAKYRACSVHGCLSNAHHTAGGGKGICPKHKHRLRLYGDLNVTKKPHGEVTALIEDLVSRQERTEDCITWPYARDTKGYARYTTARKSEFPTIAAHRYICFRVHGSPPSKKHHAAHSCGKGHEGCVNPGHLSWKTPGENLHDKIAHGTHMYGEAHPKTKFSDAVVVDILADQRPLSEVCASFNISESQARKIRNRTARLWVSA